jgi:hypothetical protein
MNKGGWRRERDINGVYFMPEVTEYFIHQLSEADWLMTACDSTCAEASKTWLLSFVLVTLTI